jgi:hypothetical protein
MFAKLWQDRTARFVALPILAVMTYLVISLLIYNIVRQANASYWRLGSIEFTPVSAGFLMLLVGGGILLGIGLAVAAVAGACDLVFNTKGGGLICAALILAGAYVLTHLEPFAASVQNLTNGEIRIGLTRTRTLRFGTGSYECTLKTYWSNGRLHYLARHKISPLDYERAHARRRRELGASGPGMDFSLQNRFGGEVIRLEIPEARFRREEREPEFMVASGSVAVTSTDYTEMLGSAKGRYWNYLRD